MAEFQEVMRQWGRYCKGYTENHNDDCDGCPFEINGSCNSYAKDNAQYAEQIEKHVMAWAAEHPEPVYELWGEWFEKRGDLIRGWHNATNIQWIAKTFGRLMCTPIPVDIAQKLGIEPKNNS